MEDLEYPNQLYRYQVFGANQFTEENYNKVLALRTKDLNIRLTADKMVKAAKKTELVDRAIAIRDHTDRNLALYEQWLIEYKTRS